MVGSATTELVAFVGRLCLLEELDFGPVIKLILVDLTDCCPSERASADTDKAAVEDASVIGRPPVECVVMVALVSTRVSDDTDGLDAWLGVTEDRLDVASRACIELSLISFASLTAALVGLTPPTASRNRLYKPLRPFCTNSPAPCLLSDAGIPSGGGA